MYSRFTDRSILPRIKVLSYKFFFFKGSIFREIFSIYRAIKIHTCLRYYIFIYDTLDETDCACFKYLRFESIK